MSRGAVCVLCLLWSCFGCCSGLSFASDRQPKYLEHLKDAEALGQARIEITGPLAEIGAAIDDFLTPRLEWRVSDCTGSQVSTCVLVRAEDNVLSMFQEINRVQFPPSQADYECAASVSVSGQKIGATTQVELRHTFDRWLHNMSTAFVPVWTNPQKRPDQFDIKLFKPFCDESAVPTTLQDCFFLPMSSCRLGPDQWEHIRKGMHVMDLNDVLVDRQRHKTISLDFGDESVLWQMVFFRQNARTRGELVRLEKEWREKNPSWPNRLSDGDAEQCVAVHVRHGDMLTPFWIGPQASIESGFNRTLDDYLDEALEMWKQLPADSGRPSRNARPQVFVMSDDLDIINTAHKSERVTTFTVEPGTSLYSLTDILSGPNSGKSNTFYHEKANSDDMLSWLLSIRLMSDCDMFVGNLDSEFTTFIYNGVCERRNGNCPKATTLGGRYNEGPLFNYSVSPPQVVARAAR